MKPLNWRQLRGLASSKIYKLTALFPIIGYLIILYPGFNYLLSHAESNEYTFPLITSKYRLYLLYFGLMMIGLSSLLMLKIPQMFVVYETSDNFADLRSQDSETRKAQFLEECENLNVSLTNKEHVELGEKLIFSNELDAIRANANHNLRQLYITYYNINGFLNPGLRKAILILFGIGLGLLSIISLDTATSVIERLIRDLLSVGVHADGLGKVK